MRGASLLSGLTPCLFADLSQEVDTFSMPLAEVSPCATKRTCSAWRTGISIDGGGVPILSGIAAGISSYFVDLRLLRSCGARFPKERFQDLYHPEFGTRARHRAFHP